ncbi:MAG: DUF1614 domain-containing protein [Candidatus Verstraetearchaeota archaeon]|nr:DUF1614 domain-containing protein [Candidatus Verstraetearchaeota archaeon]
MSSRMLSLPVIGLVLMIFFIIVIFLAPFLFLGLVGRTLHQFGLGWFSFLSFLLVSLVGSTINLPIWRTTVERPVVSVRYVYYLGIPYPVPSAASRPSEALISINLGGAIMPIALSAYLLLRNSPAVVPSAVAVPIIAVIIFFLAKPVQGLGIITPMFIPPLISAIVAVIIGGGYAPVVAYVGGTVGTLVGADLLHINSIKSLGAANMSIGGAGTFDGIFLTGLLAVLLAF